MSAAAVIAGLRRILHGNESTLADQARVRRFEEALADPEWQQFAGAMQALAERDDAVHVGTAAGQGDDAVPLLIERDRLRGSHLLAAGATGGGKTYMMLGLVSAVLADVLRPGGGSLVTVEAKGELSTLLVERLLPGLLAGLPEEFHEEVLARIHVLDPFSADVVPALNVIATPPGVSPDLHRMDLLHGFEVAADAAMGIRQRSLLTMSLRLLEEHGLHLPSLPMLLTQPALLQALAQRSSSAVRTYFTSSYPRESEEARTGVLARLERVMALSSSRLALSADTCVDFRDVLREGITVISLAAPFGCREAQRFWSAMLVARLLRAVFARPNDPSLPQAVILSDEAQDFLQGPHAAEAERVLTQARSRRVSLWLACQQFAQLDAVSPTLAKALRTNCNLQVLLRASPEDARAMRHILPVTGRMPRPAPAPWEKPTSPVLTEAEEHEELLDQVPRLPDRVGWWWDRRQPWKAILFGTRDVVLDEEDAIPEELRQRVRLGRWSVPVAELEQRAVQERERLAAIAGPAAVVPIAAASRRSGLPNVG